MWKSIEKISPIFFGCLLIVACTTWKPVPIDAECRIGAQELAELPDYSFESTAPSGSLSIGTIYKIEGMYYGGFEESGFIPESFLGWEHLRLQKYSAFCVKVDPTCWPLLETPEGQDPSIVELVGAGRYISEGGTAHESAFNQCALGTIRIEGIMSRRVRSPN